MKLFNYIYTYKYISLGILPHPLGNSVTLGNGLLFQVTR